ncbi:DNA damage-inducible protein 1 [Puttea exsequens]|nr:DNA damage-inducible protein 1 [Puttea exsequens]
MTIRDLKAFIEAETGIKPALQSIRYNEQALQDDNKTLQECQLVDDSLLVMYIDRLVPAPARPQPTQGRAPARWSAQQAGQPDAETIRLQAVGNPNVLAGMRARFPDLAEAVNDRALFHELWNQMQRQVDENRQRLQRLEADEYDPESQKQIYEMIRQNAVMENMEAAMENTPEVFGRVHMLYIPVKVNSQQVKAFVDSGAQTTIMSPDCAENCGILRLLDKRYAGMARGVGTAKILGRVHSSIIEIGGQHFPCSFTVMEGKDVDLLLGLDMLKRYNACIDLGKSKLVIPGGEKPVEVSFLGEADIPKHDEVYKEEPTINGPEGKRIGAISGTVMEPQSTQQAKTDSAAAVRPPNAGAAASASSGQQPLSTVGPASFPKEDIDQLTNMGFSRQEAIQALEAAGGNVEIAAGLLFDPVDSLGSHRA